MNQKKYGNDGTASAYGICLLHFYSKGQNNICYITFPTLGYAYGGQRPHSHEEHIVNPNAVVINHQNGVEVLNLLSGRPITRLQLPADGAVYGVLDAENDIKKLSWGEQEQYSPCFLDVQRIFPIRENLERFPVCITRRMFFTTNWVYDEDMFVKLPPLIVKRLCVIIIT